MKKLFGTLFLAGTLIIFFTSCDKNDDNNDSENYSTGFGGASEISVYVRSQYYQTLIPAARIFVKFGATTFPGEDTTLYDAAYSCGTYSHGLGHVHVENLHQGAYWLFTVVHDSASATVMYGGNDIVLETETDNEEITLYAQ